MKKDSGHVREFRLKRRTMWLFLSFTIFLLLILLLIFFLPFAAGLGVRHILQKSMRSGTVECKISQIGLFQANLAFSIRRFPEKTGRPGHLVLNLPHCRISYRPWALLAGRIDRIDVIGASVPLEYANGVWKLPVAELFSSGMENKKKSSSVQNPVFELPNIGTIRLQNAGLMFRFGKQYQYLPLSFEFGQGKCGWKDPYARGNIQWSGNRIVLRKLNLERDKKEVSGEILLRDFYLNLLPFPLDRLVAAYRLSGKLNTKIAFCYSLPTQEIKLFRMESEISDFTAFAGGQAIVAPRLQSQVAFDGKKGVWKLENIRFGTIDTLKELKWNFNLAERRILTGDLQLQLLKYGSVSFQTDWTLLLEKMQIRLLHPWHFRQPFPFQLETLQIQAARRNGILSGFVDASVKKMDFRKAVLDGFAFRQGFESGKKMDGTFSLQSLSVDGKNIHGIKGTTELDLSDVNTGIKYAAEASVNSQSDELRLSGRVRANLDYVYAGSHSLGVQLGSFQTEMPGDKIKIRDLNLRFEIPSFPVLRSAPGQELSIGSLEASGCKLNDFQAVFRMDSLQDWTLEKFKTRWAGGTVRMESVRFAPGTEPDLTVHCDRINIGDAFSQMGVSAAQGNGTLSGTLPVSLRKGIPVFGDGFLGSTPGVPGELKLGGTEMLTAGVSKESSWYPQLKFSQEALKHFSYQWAKASLVNSGKKMQVRLQLNGQPVKPLPFRYENGRFIEIDGLTKFSGVQLDVNFTLPFEYLWNLAERFQKIKKEEFSK